jgi:hypothetical protein
LAIIAVLDVAIFAGPTLVGCSILAQGVTAAFATNILRYLIFFAAFAFL